MSARLVFVASGLVIGVVLALVWTRGRAESRALAIEREALARADALLVQERAAFERRAVETQGNIAERKRAVLATQSAADRARAKVGHVVARLKAAHAGRPPKVRAPAPPVGAGGSSYFPELMSDPEYSALYAKSQRLWLNQYRGGTLRRLGLPEETVAKAIDVLVEGEIAVMDVHNIAGSSPFRPPVGELAKLQQQLRDETAAQLKALLGAETYQRYKEQTEGTMRDQARYATQSLERRLSYSEEPLTAEQLGRLHEFEVAQGYGSEAYYRKVAPLDREARKTGVLPVDEAKLAFYRSVLTPRQMEAVEELHREREAALKRELLPKTVEKKATGAK